MGRQNEFFPYRYLCGVWDSLVAVGMLHALGGTGPELCARRDAVHDSPPARRPRRLPLTAPEQRPARRMRQEPSGRGVQDVGDIPDTRDARDARHARDAQTFRDVRARVTAPQPPGR
ncbi:hypothetical protein [Streptomyces lancefieldiae]|uniref:Uncharacterized protein n=1 Tax=Streptomyces lancefieldiae TaxID=3075520 RepID=A0ABU3AR85_9ACTN|nr:hypothetical protein [Streptomyces sp. DSM 40712]MDT0612727.1 hypothetical protein [Streptomyces sp. DSM 40712]